MKALIQMTASICTTSGTVSTEHLRVTQMQCGEEGVTVFYVDAHNRGAESLHPDHAVTLHIAGLEDTKSYCAVTMYSEYWSHPKFGNDLKTVPARTQGLIVEKKNGMFCVFLPMVSEYYKCDLQGEEAGLSAVLYTGYDKLNRCKAPAFCYMEGSADNGNDPFAMLQACAKAGMEALGQGGHVRAERRYPELFEYLGWCSWDAMQIRVSEDGLLQKCTEFVQKQIPVRWAILDDMWADIREFWGADYQSFGDMCQLMHASSLYDFEADPIRFPEGLKHCIDRMKEMGMTVGMWHPVTGYWRGINPEGPLFAKIKDLLIQRPDGRWIPSPEPGKLFLFYQKFHSFLRACGAEFVKIDYQSCLNTLYRGIEPIGVTAKTMQTAIEASAGAYFDGNLINCMGMASENMWNRTVSNISRCSDDFKPEDRAWFTKHITQCAYNSLVQGQFCTCDWDMWWTDDGQAVKNSVLRAISGGPIYISDQIGRSKKEILSPLILDDGRILRCDRPAMPAKCNLTNDPEHTKGAMLVQNTCCNGKAGVVAAFNLHADDTEAAGCFGAADIYGLIPAAQYAVYEYFTGEWCILDALNVYRFTLENQDAFRLYLVVPYLEERAVFGIIDKMIAPKTIVREGKNPADTETCCPGRLAYIEHGALHIIEKSCT